MINWEVIIWTCITLAVIMGVIGLILYAISAKNMRNKRKELGEVHTDMKVGSRITPVRSLSARMSNPFMMNWTSC